MASSRVVADLSELHHHVVQRRGRLRGRGLRLALPVWPEVPDVGLARTVLNERTETVSDDGKAVNQLVREHGSSGEAVGGGGRAGGGLLSIDGGRFVLGVGSDTLVCRVVLKVMPAETAQHSQKLSGIRFSSQPKPEWSARGCARTEIRC